MDRITPRHLPWAILLIVMGWPIAPLQSAEPTSQDDYIPQSGKFPPPDAGKFPPPDAGKYISGELVFIDPVNRRGGIRLSGEPAVKRYQNGPLHYFALLPYGMVWRHGAPAELRDLPIGTHVHGYFFAPPVGEEETIPPLPAEQRGFAIQQNHALRLEDDFSFYSRQGQSWKIVSVDQQNGKLHVSPAGTLAKQGINQLYTFDLDNVSQVWKGRTLVDLDEIPTGASVQLNLGWSPAWREKEYSVSELWLDEPARTFATELQRRRHLRYQRQRWAPGWIDAIEHYDFGGGMMTITLFGGMDPALYKEMKQQQADGFGVACAEKTLRTWFHRGDKKIGQVTAWNESKNPPPGSSGIQIRLKFTELLAGYRPGACVRVKAHNWKFVTMPPEERVKSVADRERGETLGLP